MNRLTPAEARALPPGKLLRDHEVKGLVLRAGKTGGKSWHLRYRTKAGIEREPKIGSFPELSLDAARRTAKELWERISRGEDPSQDWKGQRGVPTVAELSDNYLRDYAPGRRGKAAMRQHTQLIEAYIKPGLGHKRVDEVTTADVDRFLRRVCNREFAGQQRQSGKGEVAHWSARHTRACLWQLFTVGMDYFKIPELKHNPVRGSMTYARIIRKRHATPDELARIAYALRHLAELVPDWGWGVRLKEEAPERAACIWTLFLTGARVSEIRNARWDQIVTRADGSKGLLLKEHKTAKQIGEKELPLPPAAWELIEQLPRPQRRIFPTTNDHSLRIAWDKVREVVGCRDLKLLDARRTFASYALSMGKSLSEIGELLWHTDTQTTKGYAHLKEDARVRSVNEVAAAIEDASRASA